MRIRSIRPEFWSSEDVAAMTWDTRLVFIGLWSYVDDNGVGRDDERLITAALFPLDLDPSPNTHRTLTDISGRVHRALLHLSEHGQITRYAVDGRKYLHVTSWASHQKIERASKGRYPLPTCGNGNPHRTLGEPSPNTHRILPDMSPPGEGEKGRRGEGEKGLKTPSSAEPMDSTKYPIPFERFWKIYPRKVGKDSSLKAWLLAGKRATFAEIIAGAERMAADPNLPEETFIPHPTTWLRRGGWNDAPYPPVVGRPPKSSTTDDRVNAGLSLAHRYAEQEAREEQQQRMEISQ